ncbi:hypothetical protein E2C01_053670 [Portunus trituberculatus]|uniref:Uncharacterized protein n=1 Tax=Portunus trituberculatus TaxID=210409 RepID=A0A5B7GQ26_PORTR|nr:hypothetical protein [Portunus trituberculatus]
MLIRLTPTFSSSSSSSSPSRRSTARVNCGGRKNKTNGSRCPSLGHPSLSLAVRAEPGIRWAAPCLP